ncbi:scavenger receptor class B member 1-like [Hylaeus volcanicus]|uniref:scavenger receptor class B member 1-like n=1 Tax=Hylaeus volcanicus TaxID=313075 RepID=UPI0023B81638|nr:scavenger receptor class B member 1-like [Hylaeus volcanicus]
MEKMLARAIRNGFDGAKRRRVRWSYGLVALTSIVVFVVFWFTNVFRNTILSNLELRNGTTSFLLWQRPPVGLTFNVYVFNYTNLREFERGNASKLRVQEVGPFTYRENLNRVNVELHENGTVTYQEKRSYRWVSGESENATVIVPNVLLMSTLAYSRNLPLPMQLLLTMILSSVSTKPFLKLTVGEYLWGYEDKLFQMAKPFASLKRDLPFDKFGILAFRNAVNEDRITIHTGVGDLGKIGLIERLNGEKVRKIWGNESCDRVYGTDGSMFPPQWIERPESDVYIYAKDVCRAMPLRYEGRHISSGIPSLRYKVPSDVFTSTRDENSCFCPKESDDSTTGKCPPLGTFNVSACNFGAPFILSFPHFHSGDKSLFERIDGLTPREEHRESFIDVHPILAVTIATRMKFQVNLEVRKATGVPFAGNLKDGSILPLVWIDSGIEELPEAMQEVFYRGHYVVSGVEAGLQWCSLVCAILSCAAFFATFKKNEETNAGHDPESTKPSETSPTKLAPTGDVRDPVFHLMIVST